MINLCCEVTFIEPVGDAVVHEWGVIISESDWSHERVLLKVDVVLKHERLATAQHVIYDLYNGHVLLIAQLLHIMYTESTSTPTSISN